MRKNDDRLLRRLALRALAPGVGILLSASVAVAQAPAPAAQAGAAEEEERTAEPEAEPTAPAAKPPTRPPPGIEEIVIRGGESDSSRDFEVGDSVTGFGAEDLAALGAQDIEDLAEFTPNLEIVSAGSTTPTFFIRGVGLNDFNANSTGAVAIYQDDVAINAPALQLGTLFDVEAVNVLRGPQGTGPARNASAGAIKIYSRKPTGELGGFLRSEIGNYAFRDFEGAVEAPVYEDMLAGRFAFRFSERDGTMKNRCSNAPPLDERVTTPPIGTGPNPAPGTLRRLGKRVTDPPWSICGEPVLSGQTSDVPAGLEDRVNNLHNWAARGTLLFQPTLDTSFLINAHGSRRDELSRLGLSYGTNGGYSPDGYTTLQEPDEIIGLLGGSQAQAGYQAPEVKERLYALLPCLMPVPLPPGAPPGTTTTGPDGTCLQTFFFPSLQQRIENRNLANRARMKVANELADGLDSEPWASDYNHTGPTTNDTWGSYLQGEIALPWGMQLNSVTAYDSYDRLIDLDLDFSPQTLFHILTDDEGWQAVQDLRLQGQLSELPVRWDVGGWFLREQLKVMATTDLDVAFIVRDYTQDLWSTGAYASLSFDFWNDFTLDGGFRYNWERKSLDFLLEQSTAPFPYVVTPEEVWSAPTGTIRLTYRFREDTHVYWKYTRGWKPGTFNATSSFERGVAIADPETLDAFETGVRGSWLEGRVGLDLSVFYYNYQDYQLFTAQQFAGGNPEFVILNADLAQVYGSEVDLVLRPWIGAFFNVRFGWLESQFLDFVQLQQEIIGGAGGQGQITLNRELNNTGNPLLNSPRYKVSLTGEQAIPLGRFGVVTARYDGVWTDTTYYDATRGVGIPNAANDEFLPKGTISQRPYWVHNVRLAYRPPGGRVEIAGWVRNLTNEAYKTFAFDGSTFNRTTIYFVGDPRTYGGTISVSF
jgi:outer membrane receptor protein involved in Fe transport